MRAQLVPLDGSPPIDITKDLLVIGRREDCDLRLEHKSVSKIHCVLAKTDGLLMLRDLGSTNGTRVNGQRVRRAALLPNDQLSVAGYKFRVYLGPDPAPAAAPVVASEQTQHLDAKEVAELLRKAKAAAGDNDDDESDDIPFAEPLHRNQLPDVYPEDRAAEI